MIISQHLSSQTSVQSLISCSCQRKYRHNRKFCAIHPLFFRSHEVLWIGKVRVSAWFRNTCFLVEQLHFAVSIHLTFQGPDEGRRSLCRLSEFSCSRGRAWLRLVLWGRPRTPGCWVLWSELGRGCWGITATGVWMIGGGCESLS